MVHPIRPPRRWAEVPDSLLGLAAADLDTGGGPLPSLVAFRGDEPVGLATLRPFGHGEVVQALIEVLALMIPLGADRLALSLPARAWSLDDPIAPVTEEVDLRQRVVLLTAADAHGQRCRTTTTLHPYDVDGERWWWQGPVTPEAVPDAPAVAALAALLDARDELAERTDDLRLAAQLGRVLVLGHDLALAPAATERLQVATAR